LPNCCKNASVPAPSFYACDAEFRVSAVANFSIDAQLCKNHIPAASLGRIELNLIFDQDGSPLPRYRKLSKRPATIAIAYVAVSLAWIFLTDLAVEHAQLEHAAAAAISIAKGSVFVIASAALIYYLFRRAIADRERFRSLLESAPDAVVIVDSDGKINLVNAQAEKLFGYTRAELILQPVECLIPERFRHLHPQQRRQMLVGERVRPMGAGLDLIGRRKDGSEFPADISLSPIRTADGIVVCSAVRDISDRKLAEEQIKTLNMQLEEALRRSEKLAVAGRLIATVAHEINNPLDALGNLLYLMKSEPGNGQSARALVEAAQIEVQRLVTITRQTLAPHREPTLPVVTKLSTLLDDVVALFAPKLKGARVNVRREYEIDGEVLVSPGDFRQVFTNLVSNALDAMTNGGELRLNIEKSLAGDVVVRIGDTGCGIPPENVSKIFEPFFTTKGEKGTGIGLWVIKGIVERTGGKIEVVSSTTGNTGSCFSVFLPAEKVAARTA
jgi:PAS domain S-box-containing protein